MLFAGTVDLQASDGPGVSTQLPIWADAFFLFAERMFVIAPNELLLNVK